jgi:hypothetical protein
MLHRRAGLPRPISDMGMHLPARVPLVTDRRFRRACPGPAVRRFVTSFAGIDCSGPQARTAAGQCGSNARIVRSDGDPDPLLGERDWFGFLH